MTVDARIPPHDLALERGVLAAVLIENAVLHLVLMLLRPEDMYSFAHQIVLRAMTVLAEDGKPIDWLTLRSELLSTRQLQAAGGDEALAALTNDLPNLANVQTYCERIVHLSTVRRAVLLGHAISAAAYEDPPNLDRCSTLAAQVIAGGRASDDETLDWNQLVDEAAVNETRSESEPDLRGAIAWGIEPLDDAMGPMLPGDATVVAADTNVGKTWLGLHLVDDLGRRDVPMCGGFISLEDQKARVAERALAIARRMFNTKPASAPKVRIRTGAPLDWILRSMATLVARFACKVIVVDYAQAIRVADPKNTRTELADAVRRIKDCGATLGVHTVITSQVTIDNERSQTPRYRTRGPTWRDIRDSRDIAHAADNIIVLWRNATYATCPVRARVEKTKGKGLGARWWFDRGAGGTWVVGEGRDPDPSLELDEQDEPARDAYGRERQRTTRQQPYAPDRRAGAED